MDKNKGVKIGIVIPIYNTAKYLRECLDSVANQSYKNFHAVLVNDGSCDDSKEIALDYVAKDSRFVLIDKENGGQSSARNAGIAWFSNDSSLRGEPMDSPKQSKQNQNAQSATESRPIRGAKNRIQGCSSATADFLLESEKRGTPPKSEKRQLLARRGSGAGGAALLREKTSESKRNKIVGDSQVAKMDCHDSALLNLAMTAKSVYANATHLMPPRIDYIIFLDSDDFWELDLLEKCVDSAQITQNNPDIIWFDWNEIYEVSGKIQGRTTLELFGFTTQTQITATQWLIQAQKKRVISFWFSVMGLIRFDYLRRVNLRFLEGVIFEDNLFGVLLFSQCESIAIVPRKLYNYRIRGGSTTNSTKSLPPFVAPLKAHFSTDSEAWAYFCAYSLCEMSLEFANFCANLSEKNRAKSCEYGESKLCESTFLPNFLAESCDILAFSSDPLNAKSRFIALLKQRGKYSPYLKIIAHIVPRRFKRLRFALFLFYFAPKVAFFRTMRKILKILRICCG